MKLSGDLINAVVEGDSVDDWRALLTKSAELSLPRSRMEDQLDATEAAIIATTIQESLNM